MRAVVFGAGGMLGRALAAGLSRRGVEVAGAFGHGACDIADAGQVEACLSAARPDAILNAAAYTDVDGAESHQDAAHRANALGPEVLARAAAGAGALLVHYSTDFVFGGDRPGPHPESAAPEPRGVYAMTKLEGERRACAAHDRVLVLRVGCLYGQGGRNFPSTLLGRLRRGEAVRADDERHASPTWIEPVVDLSARLARAGKVGLYHATADGQTTWADFARFLAAQAGVAAPRIEALPTAALSMAALRPRWAVLEKRALADQALPTLGDWRDHVRGYVESERASPAA